MDPNQQNNNQNSVQPQATQPATEQAAPAQPAAQPAEQLAEQPAVQPVAEQPAVEQPAVQPVAEQPDQAQATTEQPEKKKLNGMMIALIAVVVVLLVGGGVFAALMLGGVFNNPTPTPELAKSVCEKYGGTISTDDGMYGDYENYMLCDNHEAEENLFMYGIAFLKEESLDEMWEQARESLGKDYSDYEILENSDTYIKVYTPQTQGSVTMYSFAVLYKNAVLEMEVLDGELGEKLLVELGFPDRSRGESYAEVSEDAYSRLEQSQYDTEYREDMSMLSSNLLMYQANNMGYLPEISDNSLVGFEDYLTDDFRDPMTGNEYMILAYNSLAESPFAVDQSELNSVSSDEMYVFYKTRCDGETLTASDDERDYTIIHASMSDDSYICINY